MLSNPVPHKGEAVCAGAYLLLAGGTHHGKAAAGLLPLAADSRRPLGGEEGALHSGGHCERR
jgi:hypothetical protein